MNPQWKMIEVDLGEPLPQLNCESAQRGVYAVFFQSGVALGHCQIAKGQLPLAPTHVASLGATAVAEAAGDYLLDEGFRSALAGLKPAPIEQPRHALESLMRLEEPIRALSQPRPVLETARTLTVAICTHERPAYLARCLESILASSESPHEILVVDNAPLSDATENVVKQFEGVHYLREPKKGLSAARNAALSQAAGDIVAFADDDIIVHPEWAARIRRSFDDPSVMVVTGLVLAAELETEAQHVFEHNFRFFHQGYRRRVFDSSFFKATRGKGVPVWSIGAGANMAIRRSAFDLGYRFDTRLGPGVFGGCGEDSEYWYRLLSDGWSCIYEPSICVSHFHRRELSDLRRLVYQYMQGHVAALILQFAKTGDPGNLRRLLFRLPAEYLVLFLRLVAAGFSLDNRIMLRGALGCIAGLRFVFRLRRPSQ